MAQIIDALRLFIENLIQSSGYFGIALIMFAENLLTPIPSELVLPLAGFLVEDGQLSAWGVLLSSTVGVLLGALLVYHLGVWISEDRLRTFIQKHGRWIGLTEKDLDRAQTFFDKHGNIVVLVGRLIPFVRSIISLPAGINGMNMGVFVLYTTIGTLIWNSLLLGAGYLLGDNWRQVLGFIDRYETLWWIVLACLLLYWVVNRLILSNQTEKA